MAKVFILGLDGATLQLIDPLLRQGKLPHLGKLVEGGVRAPLVSTIPPASCPAWDSFITGKNPGKLGVYDVFYRKPGTYGTARPNAADRRGRSFWNFIPGKAIIVNIPMTFPPERVNGILIAGRGATEDSPYTYPPEVMEEINAVAGGYIVTPSFRLDLQNLHESIDKRAAVVRHLLKKEWDLFVVNFLATDVICHGFWGTAEVEKIYAKMDAIVGDIRSLVGSDAHFIVMSDHGNGPPSLVFWPNAWLRREGFLRLRQPSVTERVRSLAAAPKAAAKGLAERSSLIAGLYRRLPERVAKLARSSAGPSPAEAAVDWDSTVAYSIYGNMPRIFINLKGREPHGSVEPADYESVRGRIIERLRALTHPLARNVTVYRREEIYHGPLLAGAPDILVQFDDFESAYMQAGLNQKDVITPMKKNFGWHRPDGIFLMGGPGVKRGVQLPPLSIMDIAPLVLHLFGTPVPRDMDGVVRKDLFEEGSPFASRDVLFTDAAADQEQGAGKALTAAQEEKIIRQLQSIGYS